MYTYPLQKYIKQQIHCKRTFCKVHKEMEKDFRNSLDRQKRKLAAERKRFFGPLKIFLERKYGGVYKEYMKLFSSMDAEAPRKKDLTTTKVFRKWLDENQGPVGDQGPKVLFTPRVALERVT